MPPVESLKALVSHVMTERVDRRGRNLVLAVFDVSRAHFHGVCVNVMFMWSHPQNCIVLDSSPNSTKRCAGRRMRAMRGRNCGVNTSAAMPLSSVQAFPALYRSELVNGFCHGDDFVTAAAEDQLEISGKLLHQNIDTKCIGMIGAAEHLDKELEVLHRTVRVINSELMVIEADEKLVPQLLEDL